MNDDQADIFDQFEDINDTCRSAENRISDARIALGKLVSDIVKLRDKRACNGECGAGQAAAVARAETEALRKFFDKVNQEHLMRRNRQYLAEKDAEFEAIGKLARLEKLAKEAVLAWREDHRTGANGASVDDAMGLLAGLFPEAAS